MGAPAVATQFGNLLDPRFQAIFFDQFEQLPDMLPELYSFPPDNGRADMRWSDVGAFGDFVEFAGSVNYDNVAQGYTIIGTHKEFTNGFQVERKLWDDDQFHIMDQRPTGLSTAAMRTRQKHGARLFNNAFAVDTFFYTNSEAKPLCSSTHTTNSAGVSTSTGFSNLTTAALTAVGVSAARIQMVDFRDDRGNKFTVQPDEIWIPINLYEQAYEIVASLGKVDTDLNNRNVHYGQYTIKEWNYISAAHNWFMCDSTLRKQYVGWVDRVPLEFAFVEDFDTLVAKWRAYMRYMMAWWNWRWVLGAQVA